ncbi:hypothetical protein Q5P01_024986 [Channa striata]|uniref:Uncharacterized protein n=1 Tax=Channa striata TaxID=64152 RepID=A0AA88LGY2_CHASR|nr:hypothetical protein Q5P01_024986 [Channa striata]
MRKNEGLVQSVSTGASGTCVPGSKKTITTDRFHLQISNGSEGFFFIFIGMVVLLFILVLIRCCCCCCNDKPRRKKVGIENMALEP